MSEPVIITLTKSQWDYLFHIINNASNDASIDAYERAYEDGNVIETRGALHCQCIGQLVNPSSYEDTSLNATPYRPHVEDECCGK